MLRTPKMMAKGMCNCHLPSFLNINSTTVKKSALELCRLLLSSQHFRANITTLEPLYINITFNKKKKKASTTVLFSHCSEVTVDITLDGRKLSNPQKGPQLIRLTEAE